jgi:hypothetical protein
MPNLSVPRYDLNNSLDAARALFDHGGEASGQTFAALLGYGGTNNGAYLSRVGAAKAFGLIDGSSQSLRVTDLALNILQPISQESEDAAKFEAFLLVPLFNAIFSDYEGKALPEGAGLQNLLKNRFGVSDKQAPMGAARFRESAEQAGLFKVKPDRMVRPASGPLSRTASPVPPTQDATDIPKLAERTASSAPTVPTYPKLLEGALEQLPPASEGWDEDGLRDWLNLAEIALRVMYRLPQHRSGGSTS